MAMTSKPAKSLEIRLLYCKDLRAFNFFQKLTVYAAVSLSSDDPSLKLPPHDPSRHRTPTDRDGDGNPEWNHTLALDLNEILLSLPRDAYDKVFVRFDLFHEGAMFGDKRIGVVHVALSEVIESDGRGSVRFVSYQVKNPEGKPNGVLTFSYKFEGDLDSDPIGNGFAAIGGFPIVNPVPETSGSSGIGSFSTSISTSSEIKYPKIDLEEYAVEETSYYPPPGTHCYPPPALPPLGYQMPPPPMPPPPPGYPMQTAGGGCYYPAAPAMPAFGPWQHGHHHEHRHHCSTRGGGGWWRM